MQVDPGMFSPVFKAFNFKNLPFQGVFACQDLKNLESDFYYFCFAWHFADRLVGGCVITKCRSVPGLSLQVFVSGLFGYIETFLD